MGSSIFLVSWCYPLLHDAVLMVIVIDCDGDDAFRSETFFLLVIIPST